KTEFGKFGETLEAVSKKLTEAQNKIAKSKSKTTTIARKLKNVEELPSSEAANLLSDPLADSSPLVTGSEEDK
ncbi:MAG TPA: DNA recombination protein RmuC, partial [Bacteroidetes bacterium]|nr:DNA recombination protein RmuC [Bacteroidota bacterium]HEX04969.1 DNA recombination protein RmuC [Bacteroidota bacterium]